VERILQPLLSDSRVKDVQTVYSLPAAQAPSVTSRNGRETLAFVNIKDSRSIARSYFTQIRDKIKPSGGLQTYVTGGLAIGSDFDTYLADDLQRAEIASIPLSVIFLLLVFGTLVAALLPVGVGGAAVVAGVAGTLFLARFTDVSTYAINIVTLVGLGVAIDYSLLIVNRFREELLAGANTEAAIERHLLGPDGGDRPRRDALLPGHLPDLDGRGGIDRGGDGGHLRADPPSLPADSRRRDGQPDASPLVRQSRPGRLLEGDGRLGDEAAGPGPAADARVDPARSLTLRADQDRQRRRAHAAAAGGLPAGNRPAGA